MCEKLTPETIFDPNTEIKLQDCNLIKQWKEYFLEIEWKRYKLDNYKVNPDKKVSEKKLQLISIKWADDGKEYRFTVESKAQVILLEEKIKIVQFRTNIENQTIIITWEVSWVRKEIILERSKVSKILNWFNKKWFNKDTDSETIKWEFLKVTLTTFISRVDFVLQNP